MSSWNEETVTCPECGSEYSFRIWRSINTSLNPEAKSAVRDMSLFTFVCPTCGKKTIVTYDILYHQMEDRMMIQVAHTDDAAENVLSWFSETGTNDPHELVKEFRQNDYLLRIVRSVGGLLEKLQIFDAGLDDRIVEILKVYVLVMYWKDAPDENVDLFFSAEADGKWFIHILKDGTEVGHTPVTDELYHNVRNDYALRLPRIREDDPVIDREWAFRIMGLSTEKNGENDP